MRPLHSKISVKSPWDKGTFYLDMRHVRAFQEGRLRSITLRTYANDVIKKFEGESLLALFISLIGKEPGRKGPMTFWTVTDRDLKEGSLHLEGLKTALFKLHLSEEVTMGIIRLAMPNLAPPPRTP